MMFLQRVKRLGLNLLLFREQNVHSNSKTYIVLKCTIAESHGLRSSSSSSSSIYFFKLYNGIIYYNLNMRVYSLTGKPS